MSAFSENLRRIRFEMHMTQEEFADMLGTTKQNISRYESGAVSPKISTAAVIAEKLGVTLSELSGEDAPEHETSAFPAENPLDVALSAELRDLTDAEKEDALAYIRFKRAQKAKAKP